jgi:hypothetical protein
MKFFLQPWQLSLLILADWINHRKQEVIEYLDDQRRCLAVKGKILGRKMLERVATIATPDTIP